MIKCTAHLGECARKAPGRLSSSDLGRSQNAGPTKSLPLWSTQEPKPEQFRPGKCTQPRACFGQFPFRAAWSLSSVDWESIGAMKVKVKIAQLCLILCDPMDYTVHGILQARILEWVAFPFSRRSSQPRDQTQISCITGGFFTREPQGKPKKVLVNSV